MPHHTAENRKGDQRKAIPGVVLVRRGGVAVRRARRFRLVLRGTSDSRRRVTGGGALSCRLGAPRISPCVAGRRRRCRRCRRRCRRCRCRCRCGGTRRDALQRGKAGVWCQARQPSAARSVCPQAFVSSRADGRSWSPSRCSSCPCLVLSASTTKAKEAPPRLQSDLENSAGHENACTYSRGAERHRLGKNKPLTQYKKKADAAGTASRPLQPLPFRADAPPGPAARRRQQLPAPLLELRRRRRPGSQPQRHGRSLRPPPAPIYPSPNIPEAPPPRSGTPPGGAHLPHRAVLMTICAPHPAVCESLIGADDDGANDGGGGGQLPLWLSRGCE